MVSAASVPELTGLKMARMLPAPEADAVAPLAFVNEPALIWENVAPLVTIGGSLVAALALLEKAMTPEQAWEAVSIDERWQLEQWGADAEAELALENRRHDFFAAGRFLDLLD